MLSLLRAARSREIGGILMGEQLAPGRFRLVEFTVDRQTGGRAHFVRDAAAHAQALQDFFRRTHADYSRFNYLGEWHSHPCFPPIPSLPDEESMRDLVHGERDIDFAVLLIVQARWRKRIECSATLFRRNTGPAPVTILPGE